MYKHCHYKPELYSKKLVNPPVLPCVVANETEEASEGYVADVKGLQERIVELCPHFSEEHGHRYYIDILYNNLYQYQYTT